MAIPTLEETFLNAFRPVSLNGKKDLFPSRAEAQDALSQLPLPGRKTEAWKYTSIRSLLQREYQLAGDADISDIDAYRIPGLEADTLVFVNGSYSPTLSEIRHNAEIIEVSALSQLSEGAKKTLHQQFGTVSKTNTDVFTALNAAYAKDGTLIHVEAGKQGAAPIHLIYLNVASETASISQTRNLFSVGKEASVKIVASHHTVGEGQTLTNAVTEILVGANADLEFIQFQLESDQASKIDRIAVSQDTDSRCSIYTFTMSGELVRNQVTMNLEGENTESHLIGAYLLSDSQHVDNYTEIHHKQANCYSNELYKGIVGDQATGVFSGKIHVYEDAQKTNAFQTNRNIVLSDRANIYTKPQLEIYADDVKCSHGATTGQIDEEAMFYLRARGIKEHDARMMLIYAFCMEVAETISLEPIKEFVSQLIQNRY